MNSNVLKEVRQALIDKYDAKTRESSLRFFKKGEEATFYGVKSADMRKIAKEFYKRVKEYPKEQIFELCENLWQSKYLENLLLHVCGPNPCIKNTNPPTLKYSNAGLEIMSAVGPIAMDYATIQ